VSLVSAAVLGGFVLLVLEVALPSQIFLGFAVGAFAVAGLAAWGEFATGTHAVVFGVASAVAWVALRLVFRNAGDKRLAEGDINRY